MWLRKRVPQPARQYFEVPELLHPSFKFQWERNKSPYTYFYCKGLKFANSWSQPALHLKLKELFLFFFNPNWSFCCLAAFCRPLSLNGPGWGGWLPVITCVVMMLVISPGLWCRTMVAVEHWPSSLALMPAPWPLNVRWCPTGLLLPTHSCGSLAVFLYSGPSYPRARCRLNLFGVYTSMDPQIEFSLLLGQLFSEQIQWDRGN